MARTQRCSRGEGGVKGGVGHLGVTRSNSFSSVWRSREKRSRTSSPGSAGKGNGKGGSGSVDERSRRNENRDPRIWSLSIGTVRSLARLCPPTSCSSRRARVASAGRTYTVPLFPFVPDARSPLENGTTPKSERQIATAQYRGDRDPVHRRA